MDCDFNKENKANPSEKDDYHLIPSNSEIQKVSLDDLFFNEDEIDNSFENLS